MDHHSRVKEEFARQAETLSAAPVFTEQALLERIQATTAPTETMRILDLGCGPGIVTAALAPMAAEVVAFDLTPDMLQKARERCAHAGIENVRFLLGTAEKLPFEEAEFDAVVSRLTVHHFVMPETAISEMARVTKHKGRVVIADIVSSEDNDEAALHNALEVLRDPS
ncbi:MAG: class I SAM-dependent methyltransferase, partial [Nitrospinota bacterium]